MWMRKIAYRGVLRARMHGLDVNIGGSSKLNACSGIAPSRLCGGIRGRVRVAYQRKINRIIFTNIFYSHHTHTHTPLLRGPSRTQALTMIDAVEMQLELQISGNETDE